MYKNELIERLKKDHLCLAEFCRRINLGIQKSQPKHTIYNYLSYFWKNHFRPHMMAEDEIFLILSGNRLLGKAIQEHRMIENYMIKVLVDKSVNLKYLSAHTDHIMEHINFEEKEIYPYITESLTNWQIRIIAWELMEFQIGLRQDTYSDKFWLKN